MSNEQIKRWLFTIFGNIGIKKSPVAAEIILQTFCALAKIEVGPTIITAKLNPCNINPRKPQNYWPR
jgi:hypothetical protein